MRRRIKQGKRGSKGGSIEDFEELRLLAVRWVSRRALTAAELRTRLRRRCSRSEWVDQAAEYCLEKGYIDEPAIAEDHVRRGRESRLVGRMLLRFELLKRGLAEELVDRSLGAGYPEEAERGVAIRFAKRKLKQLGDISPERGYRKLAGSLDRRGFAAENTAAALREAGLDLD